MGPGSALCTSPVLHLSQHPPGFLLWGQESPQAGPSAWVSRPYQRALETENQGPLWLSHHGLWGQLTNDLRLSLPGSKSQCEDAIRGSGWAADKSQRSQRPVSPEEEPQPLRVLHPWGWWRLLPVTEDTEYREGLPGAQSPTAEQGENSRLGHSPPLSPAKARCPTRAGREPAPRTPPSGLSSFVPLCPTDRPGCLQQLPGRRFTLSRTQNPFSLKQLSSQKGGGAVVLNGSSL